MAITQVSHAAATCSWIDPATGLPETDTQVIVDPTTSLGFLTGNRGYRFCNFMSVWAEVNTATQRIQRSGFNAFSDIYRGPSYANIPSHAFMVQQASFVEADGMRFTQVVGARTVSPEVVGAAGGVVVGAVAGGVIGSVVPVIGTAIGAVAGGLIGMFAGEGVAHQAIGFPPIWTKVQIRMGHDGSVKAELLQHSLFPSMTFYERQLHLPGSRASRVFCLVSQAPAGAGYYNATKDVQLPAWQARGWGKLPATSLPGPTDGNPWAIEKGVFGLTSSIPGG
jgi:hypothetical protein